LKNEESIIDFHTKNLLLLQSYNIEVTNELSSLIDKENLNDEDINLYKSKVYEILSSKRNKDSKVNIAKYIFDKYEKDLNDEEKNYFKGLLNLYKNKKIPFSSIKVALQIYGLRFDDKDLLTQTFFSPYPEDLISVTDSGKGRNL
jgi:uncharacterized protein YbgA (DUF1722 family)